MTEEVVQVVERKIAHAWVARRDEPSVLRCKVCGVAQHPGVPLTCYVEEVPRVAEQG